MRTDHDSWGAYAGRPFWTRRRKTATSLITLLGLVGSVAVAFKLFDKGVPNNVVRDAATFDFEVWKQDELLNETEYEETGPGTPIYESGPSNFPGDSRTVDVKIVNTNVSPAKDATFFVYIDQGPGKIRVTKCSDVGNDGDLENDFNPDGSCAGTTETVPEGSLEWRRFLSFWSLDVDKQAIVDVDGEVNESDHAGDNLLTDLGGSSDPDDSNRLRYLEACEGGIQTITRDAPCNLGTVKGFGSEDALGEAQDTRYYQFHLSEVDEGDQSAFRGWQITFDFVFQARVPALPEGNGIER